MKNPFACKYKIGDEVCLIMDKKRKYYVTWCSGRDVAINAYSQKEGLHDFNIVDERLLEFFDKSHEKSIN
jgi:hypothetical protein